MKSDALSFTEAVVSKGPYCASVSSAICRSAVRREAKLTLRCLCVSRREMLRTQFSLTVVRIILKRNLRVELTCPAGRRCQPAGGTKRRGVSGRAELLRALQ